MSPVCSLKFEFSLCRAAFQAETKRNETCSDTKTWFRLDPIPRARLAGEPAGWEAEEGEREKGRGEKSWRATVKHTVAGARSRSLDVRVASDRDSRSGQRPSGWTRTPKFCRGCANRVEYELWKPVLSGSGLLPSYLSAAAVFSAPFCALPSLENRDNLPAARLRALSPWIHAFPAGCQFLFACMHLYMCVCVYARSPRLCRPLCLASPPPPPPPSLQCILIVEPSLFSFVLALRGRGERAWSAPLKPRLRGSPPFKLTVSTNPRCSFHESVVFFTNLDGWILTRLQQHFPGRFKSLRGKRSLLSESQRIVETTITREGNSNTGNDNYRFVLVCFVI